jgi:hypothetical protein
MARVGLVVALAIALAGCPKEDVPKPSGVGRRIAEGRIAAVRASPDGARVAWLGACAPVTLGYVPRGTRSCELRVAPVAGGEARLVASGVSTLPHGFAWTADGALLALAEHDHAAGAGRLVRWQPGGEPHVLGEGVSFYAAAPDGRVGWVARGALAVAAPGAAAGAVAGATRVATFEFAPGEAPLRLLARRESSAGGELLALPAGGGVRAVAAATADYRFSPRGDYAFTAREGEGDALSFARAGERPLPVRRNVQSFAFAPGGAAVAFIADLAPGKQGDLWVAELPATGAPGAPRKLAEGVGELRWAAAAPRLAWIEGFDPATRAGALAVGGPRDRSLRLGEKVSAFELSPDGARIAFLEHVVAGGYSVDLKLAHLDGSAAPRVEEIARGVFGFDFTPARDELWFRSGCIRNGESCDLSRIPATGLAPGAKPELLAHGVKSFDFDRRRPGRALLGFARADPTTIDLAVWEGGRIRRVDQGALAGTAALLEGEGARIVYAVAEKGREGVYVADLGK